MNFERALFCALVWCAAARVGAAESSFLVKDEAEFNKCVASDARLEKLADGMAFVEGPVWHPDGFLVFSDIPNNELKKWSKAGGLATFRRPSGNANGNTVDRQGRIVTAEHTGRRVSISDSSGNVTTVVDRYDSHKFNSPNDVVVKTDGTIWFTDPPYGLARGEQKEQPGNYVYRFDPSAKKATAVITDCNMPNGLCFSPNESKLYVADSGEPRNIRVFDVRRDGTVGPGSIFSKIDKGGPDGIRCDADGRIWSSAGDGIHIFAPTGALIGKILVPESPANLCFGGPDGHTLFITARKSLYSIPVRVGAPK